jgi:hypothetical protein
MMDIERSSIDTMDEDAKKLYDLGYKQVSSHGNNITFILYI